MYSGNDIVLQERCDNGAQKESRFNVILDFGIDELGSRRVVWDHTGAKKELFTYSAWGEVAHDYGSDAYLASFTGKEYDSTGLIYFNAATMTPSPGASSPRTPAARGIAGIATAATIR
jgi:hypothetical protein